MCIKNRGPQTSGRGHKHLDTAQTEDVTTRVVQKWDVEVWKVLQWFKFEEIKNQTSSKGTCIHSVPACACAGGGVCRES